MKKVEGFTPANNKTLLFREPVIILANPNSELIIYDLDLGELPIRAVIYSL